MRIIDADKVIEHLEKVKKESANLIDMAHQKAVTENTGQTERDVCTFQDSNDNNLISTKEG